MAPIAHRVLLELAQAGSQRSYVYWFLGQADLALGDKKAAKTNIRKAVELDDRQPTRNPFFRRELERLEKN